MKARRSSPLFSMPINRRVGARITAALSLVAFFAACTPDDQAKRAAYAAVKDRLRDPASAEFSDTFVVRAAPGIDMPEYFAACGWVNARNGFGGMAGRARFVVTHIGKAEPIGVQFEPDGREPGMREAFAAQWERACRRP